MDKGQVAMEFVMMLGMAMIISVAFIAIMNDLVSEKSEDVKRELFEDLGTSVQQEILLAAMAESGYTREFRIPPTEIEDRYDPYEYTIAGNNTYLIIEQQGTQYTYPIPNIEGEIRKGNNTISNVDGIIYVNS